jgi:hypothetical protein
MSLTKKILVSAIFCVEAVIIYFGITQRYPISGDDYSYLYQAKLFADGKLWAEDALYDPSLPFYDSVETYCLRDDQGRRFSKYAPGWPALLALGVKCGAPWLVNPLLGALLLFLMLGYTERSIGKEYVRSVALLVLLCFFLCYYAASFRAHIATAVFIFAAFLLFDLADQRPRLAKWLLFGAGALLGYSAIIRYVDWIPLAVWISISLVRRKRFADVGLFGIGFVLLASGNFVYNALLSGNPFEAPAAIHRAPGITDRLILSWRGFVVTMIRFANLLWVFPSVLLLAVFWRRYRVPSRAKIYIGLFLMTMAIYFLYPASPGGPGPRYFLAYFPFLILAVVEISGTLSRNTAFNGRHIWNAALVSLFIGSCTFAARETYINYWRRDLERTVSEINGSKNIILLKTGTYRTIRGDLTRNPPQLSSARNLYFGWTDKANREDLLKRFPGYTVFVYKYPGHLKQLSAPF